MNFSQNSSDENDNQSTSPIRAYPPLHPNIPSPWTHERPENKEANAIYIDKYLDNKLSCNKWVHAYGFVKQLFDSIPENHGGKGKNSDDAEFVLH